MATNRQIREQKGFWQRLKDRSGFFDYVDEEGKVQPGKTLWDLMQLLIVPLILAVISILYPVYTQNQSTEQAKIEQTRTAEQAEIDKNLANDRYQVEKVNAYLAKMEGYLLDRKLLEEKNPTITQMAQVQTVIALRSMDKDRRDIVIQFLRDSGLIEFVLVSAKLEKIDLGHADLKFANLSGARLSFAKLESAILGFAKLINATLSGADLSNANLSGADLSGADLRDAILDGACLSGAIVTDEQLNSAATTKDVVRPEQELDKCENR